MIYARPRLNFAAAVALLAFSASCGDSETATTPAATETAAASDMVQEEVQVGPVVIAMGMVAADTGWVLTDAALSVTEDGGEHWRDVTPPDTPAGHIEGVHFLDGTAGWAGVVTQAPDGGAQARMLVLRTVDGGETWERAEVATPPMQWPGPPVVTGMRLAFLDREEGWLAADYRTGLQGKGLMYHTDDGGATWAQLSEMPNGSGAISFADAATGWWSSGLPGGALHVTHDGGLTWQPEALAAPPGCDSVSTGPRTTAPLIGSDGQGVLMTEVSGACADVSNTAFYVTGDGGTSWAFAARSPELGTDAIIDASAWMTIMADGFYLTGDAGKTWPLTEFDWRALDPLTTEAEVRYVAPSEVSFTDRDSGWAVLRSEHYSDRGPAGKYLRSERADIVIATEDGGRSWTQIGP